MSGWWKSLPNGLPNVVSPPKSGHRRAAKGMEFPWRCNVDTIAMDLKVSWEMSVQDANAALWCGPRNGIAIADVDTTDERVWQRVIDLLGDTPIKVRSGGGNLHLWFGYNGERRSVRAIPELELDILGNGIAVVPPSINVAKGGLRVYPGWPRGNSSTPLHAVNLAA